jgi:hypothetical protein
MSEEELESIPWATLIDDTRSDRSRLIYLAAGAVILFALAALAARTLWTPATADVAVAADPVPTTVAVTTSAPPPAAPALFSEADLMASLDAESARAAAAFAEWFVYDYFTVDGDAATLLSIQDALPNGVPDDLLPHTSESMVTYVEWARATRVTEVTPGVFEVLVLFRAVAAPNGETFERQPMRAVLVPMEMGAAGGLRLTDLPSPAHVPSRPEVGDWVAPEGPSSPALGGVATVLSWPGLDTDLEPIAASRVGDLWRILVINHLPAGSAWPLVIRASDELVSD